MLVIKIYHLSTGQYQAHEKIFFTCRRLLLCSRSLKTCGGEMLAYCLMDTELIIALYTAPHSSTLAWKIPCMEEPGGLQSMGSLRVDCTFTHWRRKWQPTPVFLPGKSQGRWILVGCRLWGCTESDMTEVT